MLVSASSQLPSAQNNPPAKVACFRVTYSAALYMALSHIVNLPSSFMLTKVKATASLQNNYFQHSRSTVHRSKLSDVRLCKTFLINVNE